MFMWIICEYDVWFVCIVIVNFIYFNRVEDLKNKCLYYGKGGSVDVEYEIEVKIFVSIEIGVVFGVFVWLVFEL